MIHFSHSLLASPRFWLSGPLVFLVAVLVMLGMAVWFPKGAAEIDNLVFPLIFFPLIWAVLFFYAYLDRSILRLLLVLIGVAVLHAVILFLHFQSAS